jgi:hypothetical protein
MVIGADEGGEWSSEGELPHTRKQITVNASGKSDSFQKMLARLRENRAESTNLKIVGRDGMLTPQVLVMLCDALQFNTDVRRLDLEGAGFGDEGCQG